MQVYNMYSMYKEYAENLFISTETLQRSNPLYLETQWE